MSLTFVGKVTLNDHRCGVLITANVNVVNFVRQYWFSIFITKMV